MLRTMIMALFLVGASAQASNLQFDSNVPQDVVKKVQSDLDMVTGIQAAAQSPLHSTIYGKVDGPTYMTWFGQRIRAFGYDNSGDVGEAVAYNPTADGDPADQGHMMVTDYFVKGNQPQLARVLVLFHEARHSEADHDYWMHVNCPTPYNDDNGQPIKSIFSGVSLAGEPACDETPIGAYGASSIMINNIGRFCTNCTDKIKSDADLYSHDQVNRMPAQADRQTLLSDFSATAH